MKWQSFLDGFYNLFEIFNSYNEDYIWELLSVGWQQIEDEYIMSQPNFDPYNLSGRDPYYTAVLSNKQ